ncbi:unnamed protein product [Cuscuta campestris]|uniref:MULE transposase domain-containing protein n=1 Tax=Cuscuta campestris TaxID=132261 RepID=A0A484KP68_9ASTE|nr:unnamed protein product [Cuscuta campestris]
MRDSDDSEASSDTFILSEESSENNCESEGDSQSEVNGVYDLIVHHSGVLGECSYYKGKQFLVGDINGRRLTMNTLDRLLARNGIKGLCRYHWREHKKPFFGGLNILQFNKDVARMSRAGSLYDSVHLYIEYITKEEILKIVNDLKSAPKPPPKPRLVLQELEDDTSIPSHTMGARGSSVGSVLAICWVEQEQRSENIIEGINERVEEMVEDVSAVPLSTDGVVNDVENTVVNDDDITASNEAHNERVDCGDYFVQILNSDVPSSSNGGVNEKWGFDSLNGWSNANLDVNFQDMANMRLNENWDFVVDNMGNDAEEVDTPDGTEKDTSGRVIPEAADEVPIEDDDDLYDADYSVEVGDEDFCANTETPVEFRDEGRRRGRPRNKQDQSSSEQNLQFEMQSDSSDYAESDELLTESDEENAQREKRYPSFNAKREMGKGEFKLEMLFKNVQEFRRAVKEYGIRAHPKDPLDPTFQIKTGCFVHKCKKMHKNNHCTSSWLARKYLEDFRVNPAWQLSHLIAKVASDWQYNIKYMKAWRAKDRALKIIHGDERTQYEKLLDYRLELLRTNPGSTILLKRHEGFFKGIYICLEPLKRGFKAHCRPLVCLDGCFLKTNYGGQLLTAVGIDPNDCIFPLAYAVCEVEDFENWQWFLRLLGDDLDLHRDSVFCFMSDKQKGLVGGIASLFPKAEHRMCVRHLYTNYRNHFKGSELKDLLWDCARASYPARMSQESTHGQYVPEPEHVSVHTVNTEGSSFTPPGDGGQQQNQPAPAGQPPVVPPSIVPPPVMPPLAIPPVVYEQMFPAMMAHYMQHMAQFMPMFQPPPPPQPQPRIVTFKMLKDNGAEEFRGDNMGEPQIALDWLEQMDWVLKNLRVPDADRSELASQMFRKGAYDWWKRIDQDPHTPKPWTWDRFDRAFTKEYVPTRYREERRDEFVALKQEGMSLPELRQRFDYLSQYATSLVSTPEDRLNEFVKKLRPDLRPTTQQKCH